MIILVKKKYHFSVIPALDISLYFHHRKYNNNRNRNKHFIVLVVLRSYSIANTLRVWPCLNALESVHFKSVRHFF